jgi:hypothetical protein
LNTAPFVALLLLLALITVASASSNGLIVYIAKVPEFCGDYTVFDLEISHGGSMKLRGKP